MEIEIQLTNALIAEHLPPPAVTGVGAWVEFRGVVRGEENGQPIAALEYEAYAPMAEREMRRLLVELAAQHPCLSARVIHRVGIVPAGEAAIYAGIAGRHRAEAFALLAQFMDRLKQDVPIWKQRAIALEAGSAPAPGAVFRALAENRKASESSEAPEFANAPRRWTRGGSSDTRRRVCTPTSEFGLKWLCPPASALTHDPSLASVPATFPGNISSRLLT